MNGRTIDTNGKFNLPTKNSRTPNQFYTPYSKVGSDSSNGACSSGAKYSNLKSHRLNCSTARKFGIKHKMNQDLSLNSER